MANPKKSIIIYQSAKVLLDRARGGKDIDDDEVMRHPTKSNSDVN
jgi:hypothetical protein